MQIRKALSPEKIKTPTVVESESKEGEDEGEDEDERVLNEIEEKTNILEKKQKKEKKLQAKRRAKVYAYAPPSLFQFLFWFAAVVYIIVKTVPYNIIWGVLFSVELRRINGQASIPNCEYFVLFPYENKCALMHFKLSTFGKNL